MVATIGKLNVPAVPAAQDKKGATVVVPPKPVQAPTPAAIVTLSSAAVQATRAGQNTTTTSAPKTSPNPEPAKAATATPPAIAPKPAGAFTAAGGDVVVDVMNSDSGYDNGIYWSSDNWKTKHFVGIDNQTKSVNIGNFAAGTQIQFGIDNGQGDFFTTADASQQSDRVQHAIATQTASGTQIGFEDLRGGGDRDYNDAIINVRNAPRSPVAPSAPTSTSSVSPSKSTPPPKVNPPSNGETTAKAAASPAQPAKVIVTPAAKVEPLVKPSVVATPAVKVEVSAKPASNVNTPPARPEIVATPAASNAPKTTAPAKTETSVTPAKGSATAPLATPKPAISNDNRSGLADGTNPGQGSGKANSPNQGTNNPNQFKTTKA